MPLGLQIPGENIVSWGGPVMSGKKRHVSGNAQPFHKEGPSWDTTYYVSFFCIPEAFLLCIYILNNGNQIPEATEAWG